MFGGMGMKNRKNIIFISICVVVAAIIISVIIVVSHNKQNKEVTTNTAPVQALEEVDPVVAQSKINEINEQEEKLKNTENRNAAMEEIISKVESGETSYAQLFGNTLIVGDSLIEAITDYGVLSSESVIGEVSATLYRLKALTPTIISYQPDVLVLHYGENHIDGSSEERIRAYTDLYSSLIRQLQQSLPNTEIVVSSTFLPSEYGLSRSPYLRDIPLYNEALSRMCEELGVTFLDNSPIFENGNPYYDADGLHMKRDFYTNSWLPFMAYELDLYNGQ